MTALMSIRLQEAEKDALALSSLLSEMPVSKLISPFLNEGTKIALGGVLIYHIDRTLIFKRDGFERFIDLLMEPANTSGPFSVQKGPDEVHGMVPKIIWDFFDLLTETKAVQRLNSAMEGVALEMDASFVTPAYLRSFCYTLGDTYISSGGSLERMDYQKATDIFFRRMLHSFYKANARGTARALSTQVYAHSDLLDKLSKELRDLYFERTRSGVLQAIEVTGPPRKRGRPPQKKVKVPTHENLPTAPSREPTKV